MPLSLRLAFWSISPPSSTVSPSRRLSVVVMPLTLTTGRVTALPLGNFCSSRLPGTTSVCIGCTSSSTPPLSCTIGATPITTPENSESVWMSVDWLYAVPPPVLEKLLVDLVT